MWPIEKEEKKAHRHQFEQELMELYGAEKFDEFTKNKILGHLFGSVENDYSPESEFKIYWRYDPDVKTSPLQRINLLWVWPLYMIIVAPIKFIVTGSTGTSKDSMMGRVLSKLVGNY
ncbi:hypothetical protein ACVAPW_000914 [Shigella sonnei]